MRRILADGFGVALVVCVSLAPAAESRTGVGWSPYGPTDSYAYGRGDAVYARSRLDRRYGRSVVLSADREGRLTYSTTTIAWVDGRLVVHTYNSVTEASGAETVAANRAHFTNPDAYYRAGGYAGDSGGQPYAEARLEASPDPLPSWAQGYETGRGYGHASRAPRYPRR